jgi:hypothetical protein
VQLFYEFLGGGKPAAPPKDDLAGLLDQADAELDIEFKPDDIEFNSSKMDIEAPKAKPAAMMSLAEQLAARREEMNKKAQEAPSAPPAPKEPAGPSGPKTKEELSKMTMAEQLQYMRQ